eukprot:TRINITY_DN9802_c0_g1_i1.p1 TRINITY_DN9802_c0_g1~~TRINITY_DN9802_c0_g1_i1.p1  ORF type:complete len:690 (+),score=116.40 TRINITY_DN9802_c0_g1_i1:68-2137(+)
MTPTTCDVPVTAVPADDTTNHVRASIADVFVDFEERLISHLERTTGDLERSLRAEVFALRSKNARFDSKEQALAYDDQPTEFGARSDPFPGECFHSHFNSQDRYEGRPKHVIAIDPFPEYGPPKHFVPTASTEMADMHVEPKVQEAMEPKLASTCGLDYVLLSPALLEEKSLHDQNLAKFESELKQLRAISTAHHEDNQHPPTDVSAQVDKVMGIVIFCNAIQIGVSCDIMRDSKGWIVPDVFFALSFMAEMSMKIRMNTLKGFLFSSRDWHWNSFDLVMTVQAMVEVFLSVANVNGVKLSSLRIVRLCRLPRLIRLVRLPLFKELLMMIDGIVGGTRTLAWSMLLLTFPIYTVAIIFRETIGEVEPASEFGTIWWSIFTMFRCVMGDCSDSTGAPIFVHVLSMQTGWFYAMFYCVIVTLTSFGIFNVIIAIYVENTVVAAKAIEETHRRARLTDQTRLACLSVELIDLIKKHVNSSQGTEHVVRQHIPETDSSDAHMLVSAAQFSKLLQDPATTQVLDELDVAVEDRWDLFDILDADGSGELQVCEILSGLRRLRGLSRRSDVIANGLVVRSLMAKFSDFERAIKRRQLHMAEHVKQNGMISRSLQEKFDVFAEAVRLRQLQMSENVKKNGMMSQQLQERFAAFEEAVRERQVSMNENIKHNGRVIGALESKFFPSSAATDKPSSRPW